MERARDPIAATPLAGPIRSTPVRAGANCLIYGLGAVWLVGLESVVTRCVRVPE